jgi:hypothetical protein
MELGYEDMIEVPIKTNFTFYPHGPSYPQDDYECLGFVFTFKINGLFATYPDFLHFNPSNPKEFAVYPSGEEQTGNYTI